MDGCAMPGVRMVFLAVSIVVFVMLGSVLEGIPARSCCSDRCCFRKSRGLRACMKFTTSIVVIPLDGCGSLSPPFGVGYYSRVCDQQGPVPDAGIRPIVQALWGR